MRKGKKRVVFSLAAGMLACGCLLVGSLVPAGASETGKTTKTWTVDTSFRTRVTAELSKATEFLGGTIEFDLLSSDLKDDYNINGICESLGDFPVGVSYHDFDAANTYAARRLNYASINFNFYKVNEDMDEFSWRVGGANAENGSNESQLSSFSYYADGRIVEYSGDAGDYTVRYQREIGPGTEGFVGTQEDIDAFMTEGYSYRVEWVWGEVSEEKEVEVKSPEEMKELGANYRQGWYVVYSKGMSAPEDAYEVLFAFRTRAVYRLQNGIADNKLGSHAGFEISANSGNPRQYNNGEYSPASHNVKMELDNVAIYEGYDYEGGTKGGKSGFEGEYAGLTGLDESGIKNAGRVNSDMGAWAGDFSKAYWDIHEAQADGLRVQIANAGRECMESYATSEQTEREVCTVRFTDGEKVLSEQEVVKGFAVTLPSGKIDGVFYRWDTEGKNIYSVNSDMEIIGTPTDERYIVYDAAGGEGNIPAAEAKVGSTVRLSDGTGLVRDTYRLVGWSTEKGGEAEYPLAGEYTVTEKDVVLYAVWQLMTYRVDFTLADGTVLDSSEVVHGENAFYRGEIPKESGRVFTGWNNDVNAVTEDSVFVAKFDETYDELSDNSAVNINLAATGQEEKLAFYRMFSENDSFAIRLDIVRASGVEQAYFVRGDSAALQEEGFSVEFASYVKDYTTILFECNAWSYTISTKALDQSDCEFAEREKGDVLQLFGKGYAGAVFLSEKGKDVFLEFNEITVSCRGDDSRDVMRWGEAVLQAGEERIFGGLVAVYTSAPMSLTTENLPRKYKVVFKDSASGEILAERNCFAGGRATAPVVEGYKYDFSDVENVTENREISGIGTKNVYTVSFEAEGYSFESQEFRYGEEIVLPTAMDEYIRYRIIVGWAREKDVLIPEYKAGEVVVLKAGNYTLYPVWGIETHTVVFEDEDGRVLFTAEVLHGASVSYVGEFPKKEGYVFDGWDIYPSSVEEDMVVRAKYTKDEPEKFRVIVTDGAGSGQYGAGETVEIFADEKLGYTFSHWETDAEVDLMRGNGSYTFVMPDKEVSLTAVYTENTTFLTLLRDYVFAWICGGLFLVSVGVLVFLAVKKKKGGRSGS